MPVDNSAAESARSLLNGIDYSALIGGPLQAAITAQAMAAKSTYEFIDKVGLTTDKDGVKQAVNVTFLYQKDGQMVKLIVPLLTIVPVPLILVDEVTIQFKANINAAASSTSEESKSEAIAGELSAQGKIGWGPFSLSAQMKASYSSKKDSKATQDSRYSVEYTQDVFVHASQAGVPAGLATVLNILSSAATGASRNGDMQVSPALSTVMSGDPSQQQMLQVRLQNSSGLFAGDTQVVFQIDPALADKFRMSRAPFGSTIPFDQTGKIASFKTDGDGSLSVLFWAEGEVAAQAIDLTVSASIPAPDGGNADAKTVVVPVRVLHRLPPPAAPSLKSAQAMLSIAKGDTGKDVLTALKPDGTPAVDVELNFTFDTGGAAFEVEANGKSVEGNSPKTDANGQVEIVCKALDDSSKSVMTVNATIDGATASTSITLQAKP
ncbi:MULTISPECIES: DUF2589 domain-containing protein [Burkholderia]|uniref:DUF2589 domain-containing protein n=1 Tax=Burkholderia contaminans TaxID=488447 RepID=A0A2S5E1R9_9BURK|nr:MULTISPECIES: DUF2589 domain-containing protein [Burkholderia]EKS9795362.1 DUF2589 domain-containing protein [Burkholderia cepacia]EKS9805554.1 DUF2589 domain-containing protein [Burkholderia cepacia]EKS9813009.1 DUF2589 domain-containing protein [Burkholderia cepacia]EKS9816874.1 DUF2589 domain-containing protein [Burkholderia cepacia]EKS9825674.1 DUF2589 domain-containing protein [Burkholderia cepacia]